MVFGKNDWLSGALVPGVMVTAAACGTDYLTIDEAKGILFPQADHFEARTVQVSGTHRKAIKKLSGIRQRWKEQQVWKARRAGIDQGWLILDEVIGKHEFISYAVGISAQGTVVGIEILSYRESYGAEILAEQWRDCFKGKTFEDPFKLDEDIPNLSGATLSSRNITNGVKRLLALHKLILSNG